MSKIDVEPVKLKGPHYVTSENLCAATDDSKYIDSIPADMETQKTKTGSGEPIILKIKQSRRSAQREDGTVVKSYRLLSAFVELNMESAASREKGVGGGKFLNLGVGTKTRSQGGTAERNSHSFFDPTLAQNGKLVKCRDNEVNCGSVKQKNKNKTILFGQDGDDDGLSSCANKYSACVEVNTKRARHG